LKAWAFRPNRRRSRSSSAAAPLVLASCTALDGTVEVPATNIDLYSAAAVSSAPLLAFTNLNLGMHRVKLMPTNTKNAASSSTIVIADAIQVMR